MEDISTHSRLLETLQQQPVLTFFLILGMGDREGRGNGMSQKRHTPGQIIRKLRQTEVELAKEQSAVEVARKLGITEQTYCRWCKDTDATDTAASRRCCGERAGE
jgi:hypothetical protein